MGRRETREAAVQFAFSRDFKDKEDGPLTEETVEAFISCFKDIPIEKVDNKYIFNVAKGIEDHQQEIDRLIETHTENWAPDRMAKTDLAILRVAIYEMLYVEDVPDSVSINEAVELAKKYSHDDAGTFVNGILGGIYRSIR